MESGEIEWFEYKFVLKNVGHLNFQQINNRFWRDKIWKIQLSCELYDFDTQ